MKKEENKQNGNWGGVVAEAEAIAGIGLVLMLPMIMAQLGTHHPLFKVAAAGFVVATAVSGFLMHRLFKKAKSFNGLAANSKLQKN